MTAYRKQALSVDAEHVVPLVQNDFTQLYVHFLLEEDMEMHHLN